MIPKRCFRLPRAIRVTRSPGLSEHGTHLRVWAPSSEFAPKGHKGHMGHTRHKGYKVARVIRATRVIRLIRVIRIKKVTTVRRFFLDFRKSELGCAYES